MKSAHLRLLTLVCLLLSGPDTPAQQTTAETHITKEQARLLLASVDEILQFVSADTRLPIHHNVKRRMIARAEVNRFLRQKFDEDEGTRRMEREELVLKKFGLLDRDFHLRPFLLTLLTEQIAGYYDDKTKTVNLLDWIAPEEQRPVLAHELTHALQDQKIDLTRWNDLEAKGQATNAAQDALHIQTDEAETAREAVAEGQAMVSFVDYALKPTGRTLATAPEALEKFKESAADTSGSPILARAPLLLQQSLLFPYSEGLAFEQAVLAHSGPAFAFAGVLEHPPSSSYEILHPAAYLAHTPVPILRLPDVHSLLDAEYAPYDVGVMGELDVRMLTELFAGREVSSALAPAWDGGVYYAAQRRIAPDKNSTASLVLLYLSRWKTAKAAQSFARIYAGELPRKYSGVVQRTADQTDSNEQVYTTSEGDVVVAVADRTVFIGEGLPLALSRTVREKVLAGQNNGPMQIADASTSEPAVTLIRTLSHFGIVRAAIVKGYTLR